MNGMQAMYDDAPEDESMIVVCVSYVFPLSRQLLTSVSVNARNVPFSVSCFDQYQV